MRRDGDRWVLLDSLNGEPQYDVSPSDYLLNQGATHFTAIWPQNRLVVSALPAGALAYDNHTAYNHWAGMRKAEFSGLLAQWKQATGRTAGGGTLLQQLSARCDAELAAGRGVPIDAEGLVYAFMVTPHEGMPPVRVWRAVDGNRVPNLRLAPAPDNAAARAALLTAMRAAAKISASKRREQPPGALAYDSQTASDHWNGAGKAEFDALLAQWNQTTGRTAGGGTLLQQLSARCDAELAAGRGVPIDAEGLVFEFMVTPHEGMLPVRVWRAVGGNGVPNLRLTRAPRDAAARAALLTAMRNSVKRSAGQRREQPAGALAYDNRTAKSHWNGAREEEFGALLAQWNQATGDAAKGAALLRQLSARCDAEWAAGRGEQIDDAGLVYAFMVTPHEKMRPVRIWRAVGRNGVPNLRLAPAPDAAARDALLKAMRAAANVSASRR